MNALVKTIPVISRGFLKYKGTYFLTSVGIYVNIVTFGSKFLAIETRFRDFKTSKKKNRSEKKISRFQNTKYDFKAQISLFASKIISHVCLKHIFLYRGKTVILTYENHSWHNHYETQASEIYDKYQWRKYMYSHCLK